MNYFNEPNIQLFLASHQALYHCSFFFLFFWPCIRKCFSFFNMFFSYGKSQELLMVAAQLPTDMDTNSEDALSSKISNVLVSHAVDLLLNSEKSQTLRSTSAGVKHFKWSDSSVECDSLSLAEFYLDTVGTILTEEFKLVTTLLFLCQLWFQLVIPMIVIIVR